MTTSQREADITRVKEIIASKRKYPTNDDKIFMRALMNPSNNRLSAHVRADLSVFSHLWS